MDKIQANAYAQALYIEDAETLNQYCQQLLEQDWIAVDTEFVRVDTYFPELSLIQICDQNLNLALIDPIAIVKNSLPAENPADSINTKVSGSLKMAAALSPFFDVMNHPQVCKVFHSARQDLEVLFVLNQQLPTNIFDTQLAAIFRKQGDLAGFARVIQSELGIKLAKSQTRTNWHHRPLSKEQIDYALDDVYFLAKLYLKYQADLNDAQQIAITEDCQALLNTELYQTEPANAWQKIKGYKNLKPKQIAIIQALAAWREHYAIEHNKPKKWTMSDEVILQIAKRPPKTAQALYKVPNIKASSVKAFGGHWIALIDEVFATAPEHYPKQPDKTKKPLPQEEVLLQLITAYGHQVAIDYKITPSNFIQKATLLEFLRGEKSRALQEANQGWRKALFYRPVAKFLQGDGAIQCHNFQLTLVENKQ